MDILAAPLLRGATSFGSCMLTHLIALSETWGGPALVFTQPCPVALDLSVGHWRAGITSRSSPIKFSDGLLPIFILTMCENPTGHHQPCSVALVCRLNIVGLELLAVS